MKVYQMDDGRELLRAAKRPETRSQILLQARRDFFSGVTILVPAYRDVAWQTAQAIQEAVLRLVRMQLDVEVAYLGNTLLPDCREELARMAVRSRRRFTIWIDSDMDFPAEVVERLVAAAMEWYGDPAEDFEVDEETREQKPVRDLDELEARTLWYAGAPYPRRGHDVELALLPMNDEHSPGFLQEVQEAQRVEVRAIGFGLSIMPTAALALTPSPLFARPYKGKQDGYLGEDVSFCDQLRSIGGHAWALFEMGPVVHLVGARRDLSWYYVNRQPIEEELATKRALHGRGRPKLPHEEGGIVAPPVVVDGKVVGPREVPEELVHMDRKQPPLVANVPPAGDAPEGEQEEEPDAQD